MVQRTEGTLGLLWEVLRAGEVQEIMGGLSLRAEAHEEDGEGAAGGGAGRSLEAAALSGVRCVRDVGPCMISHCYKPCCWVIW